jgi:hypothetical protein
VAPKKKKTGGGQPFSHAVIYRYATKQEIYRYDQPVQTTAVGICTLYLCIICTHPYRRQLAIRGPRGLPGCHAFQEGSADAVACLQSCSSGLGFFLFSSFCLVASAAFSCKKLFIPARLPAGTRCHSWSSAAFAPVRHQRVIHSSTIVRTIFRTFASRKCNHASILLTNLLKS